MLVVLILTIIFAIFTPKVSNFFDFGVKNQLKVEYALINSAIKNQEFQANLLQNSFNLSKFDSAKIDTKDEELFKDILEHPFKSTTTKEKEVGKWAKIASVDYIFFTKNSSVKFSLENSSFECITPIEICKELE
ncbi:hypothetical protein CRU94_04070 [Arcobacter sp. AHV-9/2010]|uniref:hypothetical protein n=1 Tax=Arcobacter sp. AHV-9/2010 TaxID=2021861 RepID=UPI00100AA5AA|nr:hypothetical protein [Arcobacter sp. CECT 9299]RXJ95799.1 hypothetical protein CRU94_04070 [Arcobacter sp. CECT 9299]